jgi:uncharacterized protein (TIGR02453 family)
VARHFTPGLFAFLRDLKRHNDREWFGAHRDRYAADVETPLLQFIADVGPRLRAISPAYVADRRRVGGSMFRLHRDVRFSDDKSPFKTWTAARFPHEARKKGGSVPGFYVHLGPDECFGGGGVYHVDMPALTKIRRHIVDAPAAWRAVRRSGMVIHGDQLKRAPAGFPSAHEHLDDLKRKDLYTLTEFSEADVVADGFLDRFMDACETAAPLIEFQTKALGLRW